MSKHNERAELIQQFEKAVHRKSELWERCQGKEWPQSESDEFCKLRDETIPKLRSALLEAQRPALKPLTEEQIATFAEATAQAILFDLQGRRGIMDGVDEQVQHEIVSEHTTIIRSQLSGHGITGETQPAREWVGLTHEEQTAIVKRNTVSTPCPEGCEYTCGESVAMDTESKLREKNAGQPVAMKLVSVYKSDLDASKRDALDDARRFLAAAPKPQDDLPAILKKQAS